MTETFYTDWGGAGPFSPLINFQSGGSPVQPVSITTEGGDAVTTEAGATITTE